MARVIVDPLHVWYGKTHAADDVNLVVEDGEFCVFLGPSGCGKTTTLRSIAGLIKPDSGEILIDDQVITRLYPGERDIAWSSNLTHCIRTRPSRSTSPSHWKPKMSTAKRNLTGRRYKR